MHHQHNVSGVTFRCWEKQFGQMDFNEATREMADREGFEPSVPFQARTFSKGVLSTTQPPILGRCVARRLNTAGERRQLSRRGNLHAVPECLNGGSRRGRYAFMRMFFVPLAVLVSSCSLFEKEEELKPEADPAGPRLVGRVAQVPSGGGFVLVETYGAWKVPDGGLLSGVGTEGRTANLVSTGEKLGQFAAADIRSGVAKIGDSVYYRPIADSNTIAATGDPIGKGDEALQLETQKKSGESSTKP